MCLRFSVYNQEPSSEVSPSPLSSVFVSSSVGSSLVGSSSVPLHAVINIIANNAEPSFARKLFFTVTTPCIASFVLVCVPATYNIEHFP